MPSSMSGMAMGAALRKKAKKRMMKEPPPERMFGAMMTKSEWEGMNPPKKYTVKQMIERAKKRAGL